MQCIAARQFTRLANGIRKRLLSGDKPRVEPGEKEEPTGGEVKVHLSSLSERHRWQLAILRREPYIVKSKIIN